MCWSYQEIESDAVLILCTYAHHFLYKLPDYGTTITQHGLAACTKNPDFGDYTGLRNIVVYLNSIVYLNLFKIAPFHGIR